MVTVGLERLLEKGEYDFPGLRLGYLSNQASTTRGLVQGRFPLAVKYGERLTTLFSPQHGFFAEKQDNMIESDHAFDHATGLPIFSLYGEYRKPTPEMLANIDVLLVDLIDVGTRVYTFIYTMAYCLMAMAEQKKKVVILDRPNPIGGLAVEGNLLRHDCSSFVGLYPLPMRHGMTVGELALMFNKEFGIGAELEVIPVTGWSRDLLWHQHDFPWLAPSPNMPTSATALVYPGQVLWEGTSVSEARGTTQPFEFVGAPYWQPDEIIKSLDTGLEGCVLRPIVFEPTSGKYAGKACAGFQLHVTDCRSFKPYYTSLCLLQAVQQLYPDDFSYKDPPYEYEYEKLPMDLILGDRQLREQLEGGVAVAELEQQWQPELDSFLTTRSSYLLY